MKRAVGGTDQSDTEQSRLSGPDQAPEAVGRRFTERDFQEFLPHPALRAFVDRFWARSTEAGPGSGPTRIIPDGCMDVMVDVVAGRAVAVGAMTRAIVFEPREPIRMVAVRFRPGGAIPFLRAAADEFTDRFIDATDLGIRWLEPARFGEMGDLAAAVRTLERALLDRLNAIQPPNQEIAYAVSALFGPAPPSVAELARQLGWSRQHLSRAMRRHVGVSPGLLGRIARLQKALTLLQDGNGVSLPAAALRAGYFDQAHMTRDFRALAGVTPRTAATARGSIRPIPSLLGDV